MTNIANKEQFVLQQAITLLKGANPETVAHWGKMNLTQTVEHLSDFFDVSSGKSTFPLVTPEDQLPKYKAFLLSDIPFKENTKAPASVVSETPAPVRSASYDEALQHLQHSIQLFEQYFRQAPDATTIHPVFGPLNYQEWIQLHTKHLYHHLKQFGLVD